MDRLEEMLHLQNELQKVMPPIREFPSPDPAILMEQIRNNVLSLITELTEMLDETGWKPWATSNHINPEAFKSETVDAWHFMMNLMLLGGMTADDLYEGYLKKRKLNIKRQADGYDGLAKCPGCKRAYDDVAVKCNAVSSMRNAYRWCEVYGEVDHLGNIV